ncbi:sodium:solute symporter family transporter [Mucilaginibacter sp. FT3.2]|uniref:sodium:solute symporter family transporter n=1 Tax=Mucilaginibacter sp. FT3.2 TaxID=2723090 RepID=UPI00161712E4|nr:sodium/solute symporter [Mucilaginibacter sp. FT3.2]MBB6232536.1 SSS family solute:Na+ symporter [Mucilaginibacter sp. FT3.2]
MLNYISVGDLIVFFTYFILVSVYGYMVYRRKKAETNSSSHSFFLAEGSLTWWAIGASIIASNISAEQFIGMSGDGFFAGIAVAVYEWLGAATLIIVAVFFMPVYIKNKIYTMPQFLKNRYNSGVALVMSVFWLALYIFINLTAILYLGALAINGLLGGGYLHEIMIGLAIFGVIIALGGMQVVGYTDVVQVAVLIIGGLAITYLSLTIVSDKFGFGQNAFTGLKLILKDSPDHFHLIFKKPAHGSSIETVSKYLILPGFAMYAGGQWISNLNYWGCNQYITQRALGANLHTARTGILFASLLKILMPVIVMLPGIVAFVLYKHGDLPMLVGGKKDGAYSAILSFLPSGLKGLSLAVLTAAIVASIAGKVNSISTIFTLDVYKNYMSTKATERNMVWVGRIAIVCSLVIAVAFTWNDMLGISGEGGYTFVQKYSSFVSPGVLATFLLGMFWKRTTGEAAIVGILTGFAASVFFNQFAVRAFGPETWLYSAFTNTSGVYEIPFFICLGWSFLITFLVMVLVSLLGPAVNAKSIEVDKGMFKLKSSSIVLIAVILLFLSAIYVRFW